MEKKIVASNPKVHPEKITDFAPSPVNNTLGATASYDGTVKLIDIQKCSVIARIDIEVPAACCIFATAAAMVVGTMTGSIHQINIGTNERTMLTDEVQAAVSSLGEILRKIL